MRPIDFVVFDGDSTPNVPAYKVSEAMMRPIRIIGCEENLGVLSYYLDDSGIMVLEVGEVLDEDGEDNEDDECILS